MNILEASADPHLFARWFRDRETWHAWFVFLAALFGLPMRSDQHAVFEACTGRKTAPIVPAIEAWLVCGRRAGKSFVLALVAVFLACFHDYREFLAPGERGTILILASDRRQARVILRYIRALLTGVPMLARMIERETADAFDLTNNVSIEVCTASFRSVRGYAIVAALCDEIAFWPSDDAAEPDYEILDALRPGMATIPNAVLLCASSPYARRGALWDAWRKHYGKDGEPILVWQAPTRTMNPTVPQRVIDDASERDPESAAAEWLAQFRRDISAYVPREVVEAVLSPGVFERAPLSGVRYAGFVDPSGGSSDSMSLGIAHREGKVAILDALRETRPPFSPENCVREFAELLSSYGISKVSGDRYAGAWPVEAFRRHGVTYEPADRPKSQLYSDFLPLLNSGAADLLDHSRLVNQLCGLERRTARGGRDSIDHGPGAHDDIANAAAGALLSVVDRRRGEVSVGHIKGLY